MVRRYAEQEDILSDSKDQSLIKGVLLSDLLNLLHLLHFIAVKINRHRDTERRKDDLTDLF